MNIDLRLGDCLELMKTLPDGGVDAVITDPPWNMGYFEDDDKSWGGYAGWLDGVKKECERISSSGVWIFQSTKAIPYVAHLFDGWESFASVKNFSQMTKTKVPNCWDIAFYKVRSGYQANGRNWFVSNTAAMLRERTAHPTPRAEDVMNFIVGMFDWQTILDPFMGSGTTGVACVKLNRNFIGMEINPQYYEIAQRRIAEAQAQIPMVLA